MMKLIKLIEMSIIFLFEYESYNSSNLIYLIAECILILIFRVNFGRGH